MGDIFFDLGKDLPQITNEEMHFHLATNENVHEKAFEPGGTFEHQLPKTITQIKGKTFERVRFYEVKFKSLTFRDCIFDKCLLLSAEFHDCEFHNCKFVECNTNKIKFVSTYIDPRAFTQNLFDRKKYSNIGVDLFQALMKNSAQESQPEFKAVAEYHFRLWKRYNEAYLWRQKDPFGMCVDIKFFGRWFSNVTSQLFSGYGLRARNVFFSTFAFVVFVAICNHAFWQDFDFDPEKMKSFTYSTKLAFFTIGTLSNYGTGDLMPRSDFGLRAVTCQVIVGLAWIAISTAMLVKRLLR